jgi:Xaa-Pro dipeptidase
VKNIDELILLNMAAAMVDGVYQDIAEALKPGVKKARSSRWRPPLYGMAPIASRRSTISGGAAAASHNFTDRLIRPGDQAFFDIIQSFMGYHLLLPDVQRRHGDKTATRRLPEGA